MTAWLLRGAHLLTEAGFLIKDGKRVLPDGTPIPIEFLIDDPTFKPHHLPISRTSRRSASMPTCALSIRCSISAGRPFRLRHHRRAFQLLIDARRFAAHLFLVAGGGHQGLAEPRRHRRSGDRRADRRGDRRQDARRIDRGLPRLDRVFRAGRYWIPHWYKASHWIAYWDVFGYPPPNRAIPAVFQKPGGPIRPRRRSWNERVSWCRFYFCHCGPGRRPGMTY